MKKVVTKAFAKINLSLDVLGKLDNGYHEVQMVMQSVSVFDLVTVTKIKKGIELSTNLPYLPLDNNNLAYRAAEEFFKYTGITEGVIIDISKRIPVGAGLAGGSSNASAVLKAMNKLFGTGLSLKQLCSIGVNIGADVPYCILGGTRLAEGIGEKLSSLPKMPKCTIVLVKPAFSISTKSVYEKIDSCTDYSRPDTKNLIKGLKDANLETIISSMGNVLEEVSITEHPILSTVKEELMNLGAVHAQMSGSGPTIFGIFKTYDEARNAKKALWGKYKTVYICTPV
ncbi:MAG: 4-(cytidine 5'-diphospho)-2-C-methyl-D-erythritol kinase [Ruminococcaceae bacterium]|nr:4-(cytidine 5'-diphospho)-2-C-methyl-D-erythritol kinase [Oscillospiraceae bacterium]